MSYVCELQEFSVRPALSIRTRTPIQDLPQVLGAAYGTIMHYLGELGEQPAGAPFTAYYSMDMTDLDLEIGLPVARNLPGRDTIQASELPGGRVATCRYTGPYDTIAAAYEALSAWMAEQGHIPTGVAYENYLNDPADTPPEALQTMIVFPLKQG